MTGVIHLYRNWSGNELPARLGIINVSQGRIGEIIDFTFNASVLGDTTLTKKPARSGV